jgi:hypothetical protein
MLRFSEYLADNSLRHRYKEESLNVFQTESRDLILDL